MDAISEILPPVTVGDRQSILGININKTGRTITLCHHTIKIGETDKEKIRNPDDFKSITFPFEQLKWFSPRLDGFREYLNIENGYDKKSI